MNAFDIRRIFCTVKSSIVYFGMNQSTSILHCVY